MSETVENSESNHCENTKETIDINKLLEFGKNIKDLLLDLKTTFSDKLEDIYNNNNDYINILNHDFNNKELISDLILQSITNIFNYCKNEFPNKFFDILYENEDIYSEKIEFLPNINFSELYFDTTTNKTKEAIWKYLQLILFSIITSIENKNCFGNSEKLFEAINSSDFKDKLEDTIKNIESLFNFKNNQEPDEAEEDISNNVSGNPNNIDFEKIFESMNFDSSNNTLPNSDNIHEHINKLINGKIGSLAKELAEETTKDLNLNMENIKDPQDLYKELFKNPNKLMNLVGNITSKIDKKMKDGSIKESEILEEAGDILKNMKSIPGMNNIGELFKSMNLGDLIPKGGKVNTNAFQNMMDQNIKMSKMKERMKKKAEQNKQNTQKSDTNPDLNSEKLDDINSNLESLMQQMQELQKAQNTKNDYVEDVLKQQNLPGSAKKRKAVNKKKVNKKN